MHFITGKHLPRRTFLKAAGATVALPFLESMVPAGAFRVQAAAPDRTRLVCIEEVHGLAGCWRNCCRNHPKKSASATTAR